MKYKCNQRSGVTQLYPTDSVNAKILSSLTKSFFYQRIEDFFLLNERVVLRRFKDASLFFLLFHLFQAVIVILSGVCEYIGNITVVVRFRRKGYIYLRLEIKKPLPSFISQEGEKHTNTKSNVTRKKKSYPW